jgi:hypothetical protein
MLGCARPRRRTVATSTCRSRRAEFRACSGGCRDSAPAGAGRQPDAGRGRERQGTGAPSSTYPRVRGARGRGIGHGVTIVPGSEVGARWRRELSRGERGLLMDYDAAPSRSRAGGRSRRARASRSVPVLGSEHRRIDVAGGSWKPRTAARSVSANRTTGRPDGAFGPPARRDRVRRHSARAPWLVGIAAAATTRARHSARPLSLHRLGGGRFCAVHRGGAAGDYEAYSGPRARRRYRGVGLVVPRRRRCRCRVTPAVSAAWRDVGPLAAEFERGVPARPQHAVRARRRRQRQRGCDAVARDPPWRTCSTAGVCTVRGGWTRGSPRRNPEAPFGGAPGLAPSTDLTTAAGRASRGSRTPRVRARGSVGKLTTPGRVRVRTAAISPSALGSSPRRRTRGRMVTTRRTRRRRPSRAHRGQPCAAWRLARPAVRAEATPRTGRRTVARPGRAARSGARAVRESPGAVAGVRAATRCGSTRCPERPASSTRRNPDRQPYCGLLRPAAGGG